MIKNMKTHICGLVNFKKIKENLIPVLPAKYFFLIFQKRRMSRRMFSYFSPFPKVSAKNIDYCEKEARESIYNSYGKQLSITCP